MTANRLIVSALVLALAQIGFLGWIINSRAAILRSGQEILLKVKPVDPRDLLRGDYVRLDYDISDIPVRLISNAPAGLFSTVDGDIFVRVRKEADGYWRPVSAAFDAPATPAAEGEVDIKGHVAAGWSLGEGGSVGPQYGLERFYLPEGQGMDIEKDMNVRPFGIRAAIGKDGTAQIKALVDGDQTLFEEPLY